MTALELLKSKDDVQNLNLFLKSEEAKRILAAWPMVGVKAVDRPLKKNESYAAAYHSLWDSAFADLQELADQADVPFTRCVSIFSRLMKAGLVYPDGTISPQASKLLVATAIGYLGSMKSKSRL